MAKAIKITAQEFSRARKNHFDRMQEVFDKAPEGAMFSDWNGETYIKPEQIRELECCFIRMSDGKITHFSRLRVLKKL